jgi:hypothetical protein
LTGFPPGQLSERWMDSLYAPRSSRWWWWWFFLIQHVSFQRSFLPLFVHFFHNMSAGSSIYCCETWDKISRILLTRQSPSIIRASSFPRQRKMQRHLTTRLKYKRVDLFMPSHLHLCHPY